MAPTSADAAGWVASCSSKRSAAGCSRQAQTWVQAGQGDVHAAGCVGSVQQQPGAPVQSDGEQVQAPPPPLPAQPPAPSPACPATLMQRLSRGELPPDLLSLRDSAGLARRKCLSGGYPCCMIVLLSCCPPRTPQANQPLLPCLPGCRTQTCRRSRWHQGQCLTAPAPLRRHLHACTLAGPAAGGCPAVATQPGIARAQQQQLEAWAAWRGRPGAGARGAATREGVGC